MGAAGPALKAASAGLVAAISTSQTPLWLLGVQCAGSAAAALCGAIVLSQKLHQAADRADDGEELAWLAEVSVDEAETQLPSLKQLNRGVIRSVADAFLVSLQRPVALFVPVAAVVFSLKNCEGYIRAILIKQLESRTLHKGAESVLQSSAAAIQAIDHVITGIDEVALIAVGVWVLLRFKERLVQMAMRRSAIQQARASGKDGASKRAQGKIDALQRVVLPISALASWLLVAAGVLMTLHVLGINIAPLLTVGGVSGIIVGLSAQSVMSNMISGVNLFLSQPFLVGDRVEVATATGTRVLTGVVERIDPMRTIVRSDQDVPITIPNKVLAEMIIFNESRIGGSRVLAAYSKPRPCVVMLALRYQDFGKADAIVAAIRAHLASSHEVDPELPRWAGVISLEDHAISVKVACHSSTKATHEYGSFKQRLLLKLGSIVAEHGASFALPMALTAPIDYDPFATSSGLNGDGSGSSPQKLPEPQHAA